MQKLLGVAFLVLIGCRAVAPGGAPPASNSSSTGTPAGVDCNQARAEISKTECAKQPTPGQREQCENDKMQARRQLKEQYGC